MLDLSVVYELVDRCRPMRGWARGPGPLLVILLGGLAGLALLGKSAQLAGGLVSVLPWLFLAAVFLFSWWTARQQRNEAALLSSVSEALQWQDDAEAEAALIKLLSRPIRDPIARIQSLLALGSIAQMQKQFEAAQFVYESILAEEHRLPVQMRMAELGLAASQLFNEQLADAVARIDKLQRADDLPASLRADVELLALHREVLMGQPATAVEQAHKRRALFRQRLSTRAALGYALTAVAMDATGRHDEAGRYWADATLLMPPEKLVDRIALLSPLAARYPAVACPIKQDSYDR